VAYRKVHLDEIKSIPGPGTLTWRPVRATLGIRAFGTNAYTAGQAGDDVVEPHTENPQLAHEELYFVARGRARFTIDGETFEAPAGTYVFIPDPASHRHAVAEEAGTTVLSFGGPPTFTPSAWEWGFRAEALKDQPEKAREIIEDGLRAHPESAAMPYWLARLEARSGNTDAALDALETAIGRDRELAAEAEDDRTFDAMREEPRFRELVS
jgi:Cupin domain